MYNRIYAFIVKFISFELTDSAPMNGRGLREKLSIDPMFSMIRYSLPVYEFTSVPFGPGCLISIQYGVNGSHDMFTFIP